MLKSSYQLCRVFGIPIYLDISLIVLMFLLISTYNDPLYGIAAGVVLLISITLHELGHSLVSMAFGCRVRDITLMMLGGCATLLNMPRKAWQEFLVALAGPLVSLVLAIAGLWLPQHVPALRGRPGVFIYNQIGWLNMALFIFNMIPAFPMDGGRILRSFLQQFFTTRVKATWLASRIGRFVAILMGVSVLYSLFSHNFEGFMLIRLLIAYSIYQSADREYRMVLEEEGVGQRSPFGFPFFGAKTPPPPDDGKAVVSPPPYARGSTRVDVHKED